MKPLLKSVGLVLSAGLLLAVFTAGCTSDTVMLMPVPPANAQKLGHVEGSAVGSVFLALIPIGENSRTQRAYDDALSQVSEATALTDVTIQEDWYWYYLGTLRVVTVSGEAVK